MRHLKEKEKEETMPTQITSREEFEKFLDWLKTQWSKSKRVHHPSSFHFSLKYNNPKSLNKRKGCVVSLNAYPPKKTTI